MLACQSQLRLHNQGLCQHRVWSKLPRRLLHNKATHRNRERVRVTRHNERLLKTTRLKEAQQQRQHR